MTSNAENVSISWRHYAENISRAYKVLFLIGCNGADTENPIYLSPKTICLQAVIVFAFNLWKTCLYFISIWIKHLMWCQQILSQFFYPLRVRLYSNVMDYVSWCIWIITISIPHFTFCFAIDCICTVQCNIIAFYTQRAKFTFFQSCLIIFSLDILIKYY